MKKNFFLIVLVILIQAGHAQYIVTKVTGNVKNKVTGEVLKLGSKFTDFDELVFSSSGDMIRALVPGKGVFVMTPDTKAKKDNNTLVEIAKLTLHVKAKDGYLSGRGATFETLPDALMFETSGNLIEEENKYLFNSSRYDVSSGSQFFLEIQRPGEKPVIQPLHTNKDTLIINASDFKVKNEFPDSSTNFKLGFYNARKRTSERINAICPVYDLNGQLKAIIQLFLKQSGEKDHARLYTKCYEEVYESLGKPSDIVFHYLFNKMQESGSKNLAKNN